MEAGPLSEKRRRAPRGTSRRLLHHMPRRRNRCGERSASMIKIAPSILSADFANLQRDIERISTADYVHVDPRV